MNIHSKIRQDFITILRNEISGIKQFQNGRPVFTNTEEELPAIAVYLEESQCDEISMCSDEWQGTLNIGIYLPLFEGEDGLDDISETVMQIIDSAIIPDYIDNFELRRFSYNYDETDQAWVSATLHYEISYQR